MADIIDFYKFEDILNGKTWLGATFTMQDGLGAAISLLNTTVKIQFRRGSKTGVVAKEFTLSNGLTITGAGDNVITIPATVLDWGVATYFYDVEITFIATSKVTAYIEGTKKIIQNTTD